MSGIISTQEEDEGSLPVTPAQNESLPSEILGHIASNFIYDDILPPTQPTLIIITQVCRFWRDAIRANSYLWHHLSIDLANVPRERITIRNYPDLWFSNAKDLPLVFKLSSPRPSEKSNLLDHVVPYFHQLNKLQVRHRWARIVTNSYSPAALPRLKSLKIFIPHAEGRINERMGITFPWAQLTHLDIQHLVPADHFLTIFCQCLDLQNGRFNLEFSNALTIPIHIITYQHLSRLVIIFFETWSDLGQLDVLHFPVLEDLSIEAIDCTTCIDGFLFSFHGMTLRCLRLAGVKLETESLIRFVSACIMLEELQVKFRFWEDEWRDFFTALQKGFEASRGGSRTPLTLTTLVLSANIEALYTANAKGLLESSFTDFLTWWCECPPRYPEHEREATILGSGDIDEELDHRQVIVDRIKSTMTGLIYDAESCPNGLRLHTSQMGWYRN